MGTAMTGVRSTPFNTQDALDRGLAAVKNELKKRGVTLDVRNALEKAADTSSDAILSLLQSGASVDTEMMMLLMQMRTSQLDIEIHGLMSEVQKRNTQARALQNKMTQIRQFEASYKSVGDGQKNSLKVGEIPGGYEMVLDNDLEEFLEVRHNSQDSRFDIAINMAVGKSPFNKNGQNFSKEDIAEALNQQRARVNHAQGNVNHNDNSNARAELAYEQQMLEKFREVFDFSNGPIPIDDLRSQYQAFKGTTLSPRSVITKESLETGAAKLESQIRALNTGSELSMVELRTRMQQRTQVITIVTNMLKSLEKAQSQIIQNMR